MLGSNPESPIWLNYGIYLESYQGSKILLFTSLFVYIYIKTHTKYAHIHIDMYVFKYMYVYSYSLI